MVPAAPGAARRDPGWTAVGAGCLGIVLIAGVPAIAAAPRAAVDAHLWETAVSVTIYASLCLLLAARAPHSLFTRVFGVVGASGAVTLLLGGYAQLGPALGWGGAVAAAWAAGWFWIVGTAIPVTLLLLWFPDGRSGGPSRWWERATAVSVLLTAFGLATQDTVQLTAQVGVANPLASSLNAPLLVIGQIGLFVTAVASAALLAGRVRRSSGERRRQLPPVLVAGVLTVLAFVVSALYPQWGPAVQGLAAPLVPGAVTVAVVRFRLFDVEVALRRSLVVVGSSVFVFLGYAAVAATTSAVVNRQLGLVASLLATAGVAAAFDPVRQGLQRAVSRGLYGERDSPHRALAAVTAQLAAAADPEVALVTTTDQLRRTLRLPWVAVLAGDEVLAVSGSRAPWMTDVMLHRVPLTHLGTDTGRLVAADRAPRDPLSRRDHRLLAELSVPLAAVVAAVRLTGELRRSRESLVRARAEERRRLRHDLHDDLGPLLSAIVTQADVALLRLQRSPATAADPIDRLRSTGRAALGTLRRVANALEPSSVATLGWDVAVTDLVHEITAGTSCRVTLDLAALVDVDPAVEIAAFRVVGEAVTNATRHGSAASVAITLRAAGPDLVLHIADDGTGFDPTRPADGVGLMSMRARVDELGGRFSVESGGWGTRISAAFPTEGGERRASTAV